MQAYLEKGTAYIGRLKVKPDSQNKGIGTRLMQAIEEHFRMADRYELFTGYRSARNLYLYGSGDCSKANLREAISGDDLNPLYRANS